MKFKVIGDVKPANSFDFLKTVSHPAVFRNKALSNVHWSLEKSNEYWRYLELGNFKDSNVYGRRKYAKFCELGIIKNS